MKQQVEEDLPADQIEGVTIHYASRIEDVLAMALPTYGAASQCRTKRSAKRCWRP